MFLNLRCAAGSLMAAILMLQVSGVSAESRAGLQSVYESSKPLNEVRGSRMGSFLLLPAIAVSGVYNDNIYATEANEESDLALLLQGGFSFLSDWNRHYLGITSGLEVAQYQDFDDENYENYFLDVVSRLDILRGLTLSPNLAVAHKHEVRTSPDDTNGVTPNKYTDYTADMVLERSLGVLGIKAEAGALRREHENNRTGFGVLIDNGQRDRDRYHTVLRANYHVTPEYIIFAEGGGNTINYRQNGGSNRDSSGYHVTVGAGADITGKLRAEFFAGYLEQKYDSALLGAIDGINFGGNLLWRLNELTSLESGLLRTVEETTQAGYSGYLQTRWDIALEHAFRENLMIRAGYMIAQDHYEPVSGVVDREDMLHEGELGIKYLLTSGYNIRADYSYATRSSDQQGEDYAINRFGLRLGAEF